MEQIKIYLQFLISCPMTWASSSICFMCWSLWNG